MSNAKKITLRNRLKSKLIDLENFFTNLTNESITQVKVRLEKLEQLYNQLDDVQFDIESNSENTELEKIERHNLETTYYNLVEIGRDFIDSRESSGSNSKLTKPNYNSMMEPIKIPTIDLPKFSGSFTNWYSFIETFNTLINNNPSLNNLQKFHYLKTCVCDEASRAIESLSITEMNYPVALDILKDRFENSRLIVQEHINKILNFEEIKKCNYSILRLLLDTIKSNLESLKVLKIPIDAWDAILVPLVERKLDFQTRKEWHLTLTKEIPKFSEMIKFLEKKCQLLETMHNMNNVTIKHKTNTLHVVTESRKCNHCNSNNHLIYACDEFLKKSVSERFKAIKNKNLCKNCLKSNHNTNDCKSSYKCRECKKNHHTLIHLTKPQDQSNQTNSETIVNQSVCNTAASKNVLLPTVLINVQNYKNQTIVLRALLDSGSQNSYITKQAVNILKLKTNKTNIQIFGIGSKVTHINKNVKISFSSKYNQRNFNLNCYVIDKITENLPINSIECKNWEIPNDIMLADPSFNISKRIDILIGSDLFWDLLENNKICLGKGLPTIIETALGWVMAGTIDLSDKTSKTQPSVCNLTLDADLQKFWEIESIDHSSKLSETEILCEQYFTTTHKRDNTGRFIVKFPFKNNPPNLGNSQGGAIKRFRSLERKFESNEPFKINYTNFINEYITLNHMELIKEDINTLNKFYIPHHSVIKNSSVTTKLRVVFDASFKSDNALSLNDNLLPGPNLLQDLFDIVLRFRTYKYVLSSDIVKMYRQILLDKNDRDYQRIVWRDNSNKPLEEYRLNTLTYGTVCAPYIAVRCMQQLAFENINKYPNTSNIILNDFYMDDLLTGANTISETIKIRDEIIAILSQAHFKLNKWASNCSQVLPNKNLNPPSELIILESEFKTLGLIWNPNTDIFRFSQQIDIKNQQITKRSILSIIARLFDPLGLIGPVIIVAKIIIQKLWLLKLDWDDNIPENLSKVWSNFVNQLSILNTINIPRNILNFVSSEIGYIEIHGFCDASESAYGCCIYIKHINENGEHSSRLLCAKSRVAPVKQLSIPRLELCGALLLSQLLNRVLKSFHHLKFEKTYLWTDSEIVLTWLNGIPSQWKTFVGHRVAQIQQLTNISNWKYIKGSDNPADLISRGLSPEEIKNSSVWWNGPAWLSHEQYPMKLKNHLTIADDKTLEKRNCKISLISTNQELEHLDFILTKYSSYNKLKRIIAYCLRFMNNLKNKVKHTGPLMVTELAIAELKIIAHIQHREFNSEIRCLKLNKSLPKTSKLLSLSPFLDKDNIIRVGGRLKNSKLLFDSKHPIVLPKHNVTKLIIRHVHQTQLHSGIQATLTYIRQQFWPLSARSMIRQVIHRCINCFRVKPNNSIQLMGELPTNRVTSSNRPFLHTGVDFAGPFNIKEGKGRGKRTIKTYASLFICLATKAVHIELVADLTTNSFLAALKRFISRRGNISDIYSDNATNFIGANNELIQNFKSNQINNQLLNQNIRWHFIPPGSPHMGGIWEAGIRSLKYHIKRYTEFANLNYDELTTLLIQIEAILNSRPLTPLSSDPNDLQPLTPGHFLIGGPITAPVEPSVLEVNINRLSRWQFIMQIRQHFWKRWSNEYLNTLQQRSKWSHPKQNVKIGDLVVIKNESFAPLQWTMGRIIELHPGKDGLVRVVSIKTKSGQLKRSVTRVCVLPIDQH